MTRFVGTPLTGIQFATVADEAVSTRILNDSQPRIRIDAGGRITWSDGSVAGDTNLYRNAANYLVTDDVFKATGGLVTLTTNGAPTQALDNGAIAIDTTNHVFYFRSNNAWNLVTGGGGASVTIAATEPAGASGGDLWYNSTNGSLYVFTAGNWVKIVDNDKAPLASPTFTGTVTLPDNTVALGTKTTGDYVASLVAGTGVTLTNNSGETATPTIAIGQDVASSATPTFAGLNLNGSIVFEGATANEFETTLSVTDPTADRTITLPNASGTVALSGTIALGTDTTGNYVAGVSSGTGISVSHTPSEGSTATVSLDATLDNLSNVTVPSPTTNDVLQWNGTAWVNVAASTVGATTLDGLSDVVVTSVTDGQILIFNGTNWVNTVLPTNEPMGHENKADSVISFNEGTRTFSIAPASTSYTVWCAGKRFVKTTTSTVTIPDTSGLYYIYFNSSGVLSYRTSYFVWDTDAPTAYIYWNEVDNKAYFFADERHGVTLDWATHEYLHRTRGAAIANGFGATNYILDGNGSLDSHAKLDIANGTFFDEDLQVDIVHSATPTPNTWQQVLQGNAKIPAFYRLNSHWVKDTATEFPLKQGTDRPKYNLNTAGTWSTPDVTNNHFGVSWIIATNNLNEPIIAIIGQDSYTTKGAAQAEFYASLNLDGFPIVEFRPLYKIIYECKTSYTNTPSAIITDVLDLRSVISSDQGVGTTPVSDHGSMTGLADDDHTQYLTDARHNALDHSTAMSTVVLDDINDVTAPTPSSGDFLKYNGSVWVNDAIDLGTDTTGNYVQSLVAGTGVTLTNGTASEGGTPTIGIGQAVGTTSNVQFNDVTVDGNLTVNGTTTTLNTDTLAVEDNIIVLNSNVTAAPTLNAGVEVERGTSANVLVRWNETSDKWEVTNDGTTYGNIVTTADSGTVTSTMIADGTIVNADINASAAIDKTKISGTAITAGDTGTVTSTMIADGTIVNGDINASAAIAHSKLANATAGQVLLGTTTTGVVTATTVTGDVTITGAGVTNIASGAIVNADVNTSAAIALSKLASGTSAQVVIANSSGVPTYTTLSGDVTISDTGVASIAANSVALGTDTTGNYVASLVAGNNITLSNNSGEGATPTINSGMTISDTIPSSPTNGQVWYESDTGKTFVYYDSFWVEIVGSIGATGATGATGAAGVLSDPGYESGETYGPPVGTATTGSLTTSRTYYVSFYLGKSVTFDRIGVSTGAGFAGTAIVRLGIYNMDTTTGRPSTVKFDAGTVSVTGVNTSTYVTISQTLEAGWYFTAVNMQTTATTPTFRVNGPFHTGPFLISYSDNANGRASFYQDGVTGAFAAAGTLTRQGNNLCPGILRVA
jgi:hypothetical protein